MDICHRLCVAALVVSAVLAVLAVDTRAQGLTGALVGTVKDSQGLVVPGAVVRLSSPALMGGPQQVTSGDKGQWRFPILPPGSYALTVELPPTFEPYRKDELTIGAGETLDLVVVLHPANVAISVDVAASALLNSRSTGLETRFDSDYIRTVPTRRFSMFDFIRSTPGVSPTSPSSGTVNTVSVFGSAVNENMFLIDGTSFTCPCQGVSRAEPIVDVIEELHVQSMGASVEYGNIQGGVFNVVTKQGGARFSGQASYYGQWDSLTAQPVVRPVPVTNGTPRASGYERVRYRDLTSGLGGPVKRDRLWFYGAYQYLRDYDSQPGADPGSPRTYEQDKFFGKLTWRLTPSMQMMQSFHLENWVNPTPPTLAAPFVTTQRLHASVPSMTFASLTHVVSDRTMWEARSGRFTLDQDGDPSSDDRTTPGHRDLVTGESSVNALQIDGLMLDRWTSKAVLHRFQPGGLGADHHLKFGTTFERGEHTLLKMFPGGVQYLDSNGAPSQKVFRDPSFTGGLFHTWALFASDSATITDRITVDAGIRFDHSRAISQDVAKVDAEGRETEDVTPGLGTIYTWKPFSPRLGLAVKLDGNGRTMLRASYGRFNQGVLTGELDPISPGVTTTTTMAYEEATGGYTRLVSEVNPQKNLELDPHTRTPHTDEFSLALERELNTRLRASAAYIRKRGTDFISWTDVGGVYREETRTLPDGTVLPVSVLTNATSDRLFLLTNPNDLFVHYDGLVVALEKRLLKRWQASGSYTFSKAHGLQVTSNASAAEAQFSTIARATFLTFGQDPNDLTNATGRLPNDRPHIFRATGVVHVPWQGLLVAANLQYFSGRPWAATAQVNLPQGSQRILLEPRGTRRLSSQALLDLRVSKTLALGNAGNVDMILDVLNVLNDTGEEALASDNRFAATFGRPSQFMDPRRVMIGVRLNLGR
jgi:TonB dependent receptor-like, beta-barrel/Carboxypeptidase regulatory-like domain